MSESTITVGTGWTLLTATAVSSALVVNRGSDRLLVKATVGATAPTNDDGCIEVLPGLPLYPDTPIATLFPGSGAVNRLFGRFQSVGGLVSVNCA